MSKVPKKISGSIKRLKAYVSSLEKQLRMRGLSHEHIRKNPGVLDADRRIAMLLQKRQERRMVANALRKKQREDRLIQERKPESPVYPLMDSLLTDIESKQGTIHESELLASKKACKKLVKDLSDELFVQRRINGVPESELKELKKN